MKLITAVIQPSRVDPVREALLSAGFSGLTLTEVKGHGIQGARTEYYRGTAHTIEFRTKAKLEVLVRDDAVEAAVGTIVDSARTGEIGDGKVWVTPVETVTRVRTGETDEDAV